MGHSKSIKNKIFVGMQTAKDAAPFIKFNYIQHCEFKGKTINLPIYEPIAPDSEKAVTLQQQLFPYASLKLHANPFIIDRNNEFQETFCKMYGRVEQLDNAINDIVEFCTDLTYSLIISVNGQSGCGKTLFARALINKLREVEPSNPQFDWANKEKIVTLVSSVNASTEKLFLNSWVSVLRDMLELLKIRRNLKKEVILANLYRGNEDILSRLFILENIFGLTLQKDHEQISVTQSKIAFVEREKYDDDTTEHIVDFLSDFIMKEVLEENPGVDPGDADHNLEVPPVLVIFDNVYMMDKPSWDLLSMLKESCHRIGFVLLIKTDPDNRVIFHPEAVETATEFYCEKNTIDLMVDLRDLQENEIKDMVCDFSKEYEIQMKDEIAKMTELINGDKGNKTAAEAAKLKSEMTKQYNVSDYFTEIQKDVMNTILTKCEGNPLVSMQFIVNLMNSSMVTTKEKVLYPNEKKFFNCYTLNDWANLPVPDIMNSINGRLLDKYMKEGNNKPSSSFSQNKVKGIILLKAASTIGEIFTFDQLCEISPLRNDDRDTVMEILIDLQASDFIEIIDDNDGKNCTCGFSK